MKLPNHEQARVDPHKVREYLLNVAHPEGMGKAAFFLSLGFESQARHLLAEALQQLAQETPVTQTMTTSHGQKYIIDGQIRSPRGGRALVRTVWIVDQGSSIPRLITAYPGEEEKQR
jgi:hypothetical protein